MLNDIAVVGGGPAGCVGAALFGQQGLRVTILSGPAASSSDSGKGRGGDGRSTALLQRSVEVLSTLPDWEAILPQAGVLRCLRLVDRTEQLLQAPESLFCAPEIGLPLFGYNLLNTDLTAWLEAVLQSTPGVTWIRERVVGINTDSSSVSLLTESGREVQARLCVGADGRFSVIRQSLGISVKEQALPQSALVGVCEHTRPHDAISTEFHRRAGPLVLVPLPGMRSSFVWVDHPAVLREISTSTPEKIVEALEKESCAILGLSGLETPPQLFPVVSLKAAQLFGPRTALIGEAAHVLPPLGAQGLNLGIWDAAALVDSVRIALESGADIGDPSVLQRYAACRKIDINWRMRAVGLLNQSLFSRSFFLRNLRPAGLTALHFIPPLRRLIMRWGVKPFFS